MSTFAMSTYFRAAGPLLLVPQNSGSSRRTISRYGRSPMPIDPQSSGAGDINRIAAAHCARNIRVFGSVQRGEATGSDDLDLHVDMSEGRSLFDLVALGLVWRPMW
jgi:hypothetical protein